MHSSVVIDFNTQGILFYPLELPADGVRYLSSNVYMHPCRGGGVGNLAKLQTTSIEKCDEGPRSFLCMHCTHAKPPTGNGKCVG